MEGEDELIFTGSYKGMNVGMRYDLNGKTPEDAAFALDALRDAIEPYAYAFSGIDTKKISSLIKLTEPGIAPVIKFLESMPQAELKKSLQTACFTPALLPAAESYLLNQLFRKANLKFTPSGIQSTLKPTTEKPEDVIAFVGKFGSWISIKKLSLTNVQDYEVSGILSSVIFTTVNKSFDFVSAKNGQTIADSVSKGKRKSYGNLVEALKSLAPRLDGSYESACALLKTCENLSFYCYAAPQMLMDAHPDIKPPKVKGRKPKG